MSTLNDTLIYTPTEELLESLPLYQNKLISELLEHNDKEKAIQIWLEASLENNSPFGASNGDPKKYSDYFKKEAFEFICGAEKYQEEREEVNTLLKDGKATQAVISIMSAAIGVKIGLAATVVAPALVIFLMTVGKVSINAWCQQKRAVLG